jgi:hypothetical protein
MGRPNRFGVGTGRESMGSGSESLGISGPLAGDSEEGCPGPFRHSGGDGAAAAALAHGPPGGMEIWLPLVLPHSRLGQPSAP